MNFASIVFYLVFLIPLVAFFVWLMRQDKRNGRKGLIVLAVMVIGGIIWMYWKTKGN
jgi:cbb3-type cytochrome oxidase subunit 3